MSGSAGFCAVAAQALTETSRAVDGCNLMEWFLFPTRVPADKPAVAMNLSSQMRLTYFQFSPSLNSHRVAARPEPADPGSRPCGRMSTVTTPQPLLCLFLSSSPCRCRASGRPDRGDRGVPLFVPEAFRGRVCLRRPRDPAGHLVLDLQHLQRQRPVSVCGAPHLHARRLTFRCM